MRMRKRKRTRVLMQKKKSNSVDMKAAGGLVYRKEPEAVQLLLILRNGVWDIPKGKLEPGESIPFCAIREVMEETGLDSEPVIEANLGTTIHSYSQGESEIQKETFWFLMSLSGEQNGFTPQAAEGIEKVEWVPADQAEKQVGYENLKNLIRRFQSHKV